MCAKCFQEKSDQRNYSPAHSLYRPTNSHCQMNYLQSITICYYTQRSHKCAVLLTVFTLTGSRLLLYTELTIMIGLIILN